MAELTPMMRQYMDIKQQNPDSLLFFRLGDFYEMFGPDARTASKELDLALTTRDKDKSKSDEERIPMCGVPYHSADGYIARLIAKGYKVSICEQTEDPAAAKGLVKRDVIRTVTPGTVLDDACLDAGRSNYLCGVYLSDTGAGLAACDISTGRAQVTYFTGADRVRGLVNELGRFSPAETVLNDAAFDDPDLTTALTERFPCHRERLAAARFNPNAAEKQVRAQFGDDALARLPRNDPAALLALGGLLSYLYETQKNSLSHLTKITPYYTEKYMVIDSSTRRNLELVETLREKQKRGSLLWVLDKTKTAMGARLLRNFVEQPLIDKNEIESRLDAIEELNLSAISREEIREYLGPVYDLERLISKITYQSANPRDLIAFKTSLSMLPALSYMLKQFNKSLLKDIGDSFDALEDLYKLIDSAIEDDPPLSVKEGNIIKLSYNDVVDELRSAKTEGKDWLAKLESEEREKTGIKNLRIKFNKVFGYYIEVTNSYKDLVPDNYIRKQTLTNAERYITPELKELEDKILGAEERLFSLEYQLFAQVREKIAEQVVRIQTTAHNIALVDAICSLAVVSEKNNFVRPKINVKGIIDIKDGRHPVVEQMLNNDMFIANDTYLDLASNRVSIITGPNMAGKSTYMRQSALIVLMAHIGCFVPAKSANICITDRIFTRVGASDDLASGQSTFMVEMTEVANILRNATKDSLIILDEIGRGTSTFDGLSIAWSVVEHISNTKILGAKTLFATHYHELTELEGKISGVNNYCIAVKEKGDDIVFLRKIIKGGADKSYGIQVAKLAGVPESVLTRAKELVEELVKTDITERVREIGAMGEKKKSSKKLDEVDLTQMSLFDTVKNEDIVEELTNLDIANLTPIDALNTLYSLQNKIKNRW